MKRTFDKTDKFSIFKYSVGLLNHCLRDFSDEDEARNSSSIDKGDLGKLVERLYFKFPNNSSSTADFLEAGVELKCTGLKLGKHNDFLIKERLVCSMINYCEAVNEDFVHSHFYKKCLIMLLLFYLYQKQTLKIDLKFLYSVLWKIPAKDLLIIQKDYETIIEKIRKGQAHLLSEGDTIYLSACRKGRKGDKLQKQPYSEIGAKSRAFSLKQSYMRTILNYVANCGQNAVCNFRNIDKGEELVSIKQLHKANFEDILISRFNGFYGKNSYSIAKKLSLNAWHGKDKYFDAANAIVGKKKHSNVNRSEEFCKSGITMKTVRVESTGRVVQSMSFENIDYQEVFDCDEWEESRLYELFSSRFLFVVYRNTGKPILNKSYREYLKGENIKRMICGKTPQEPEDSYQLEHVFFWTMPAEDLEIARGYWEDIRSKVLSGNIKYGEFWKLANHKKFHVRPKGQLSKCKDINPLTKKKTADQMCYWFNNTYVREIINRFEKKSV